MKELTIEQKAKAYDVVQEKIALRFGSNVAEEIFSEFEMSEDEKIRKGILSSLKYLETELGWDAVGDVDILDVYTWLEEQNHDGKKWIYEDVYLKEKEQLIQDGIDEVLENPQKYGLEKQGELTNINPSEFHLRLYKLLKQFETLSKEELASSLSFYLNVVQNDGTYKDEEKQDKQKKSAMEAIKEENIDNANKVESKFSEGDWLVDNEFCDFFKVIRVKDDTYRIVSQEGGEIEIQKCIAELDYHKFTINDAKVGDILAEDVIESHPSSFVAIFKKQDGELFESYCFIGHNCKFYKGETGHVGEYVHPATKEQCNFLFQKLHEARYAFDFEKKELKKIEFDLDDIIEESYQQQADDLVDMVTENSAWSVEDEKMYRSLHNLIYIVQDCDCDSMRKNELSDWFESLKKRLQ